MMDHHFGTSIQIYDGDGRIFILVTCHQHISSPTCVTNNDVTLGGVVYEFYFDQTAIPATRGFLIWSENWIKILMMILALICFN